MQNELLSVITARHCQRAFLRRPVPRATLAAVLAAAANAPSTRNGQPWQVAVLRGAARDSLSRRLCEAFDGGVEPRLDYLGRAAALPEVFERRAAAAAAGLLLVKGIARDDAAGRRAHLRQNFLFHGAPVELIFHLAADAAPGTFFELGCFAQNVMLGLVACGLGSCPQASVAGYGDVVREQLGFGADRLIVCGMAVGYPDLAAPVNGYVPERAALADYTQWFDEPPSAG
ncbi:MAG TPA: nitroreductase [Thermoanaerobaculia bacterium]|jgi:nitroreductase|nr:nitroreductase [Thermoanaerobaculia bacterium]